MNPFFQTEHPTSVYNFEDVLALRVKNAESVAHKIFATCYFHENDFPLYMHSHSYYEINVMWMPSPSQQVSVKTTSSCVSGS